MYCVRIFQRGIMLSIIICVYNTEKDKFKHCLSSISNSILENYEVVIIDDGSTIDYSDLITYYSEKMNINYIKTENNGTLKARLFGINKCKGDHICYVDSDDTVSFCYHQASMFEIKDADILINDWAFKTSSALYCCSEDSTLNSDILSDQPLDVFFSKNGYEHSYYVLWNKIFKKDILLKAKKEIEKHQIEKLVYAEDVLISYFAFYHSKLIKNTHLGFYFYHKHSSQEVSISCAEKLENQTYAAGAVFDLISQHLTQQNKIEKYKNNLHVWQQLICSTMFENAKQFKSNKTIDCIKITFPNCQLKRQKISNSKYIKKKLLPNNILEIDRQLKDIYLQNSNVKIFCKNNNSYTQKTLTHMKKIFNLNYELIEKKINNCLMIKKEKNTLKQKIIHSYFITKIGLILFPPSSKIRNFLKKKLLHLD